MKDKKLTCQSIWQEYQRDLEYKNSIDLFEKTKQQQNFFIGRQWEGLNAPDLEKPVLNFIKRVVNYLISVLMVSDVAFSLDNGNDGDIAIRSAEKEIEKVNEKTRFKSKLRTVIKNTAVDGDSALYVRYNPQTKMADSEIIPNTNIVFGDRTTNEIEDQPYIILVKNMARSAFEQQYPHIEERGFYDFDGHEDVVTVLIRLYKKNGTVHFMQVTEHNVLTEETDTEQKLYPVVFMSWETVKDSCHGIGVVETIIPNQIAVNKLWAMALLYQKNNAFPKVFVDKTKLDKWNSSPGAVIGVIGNPNDAVATSFKAHDISTQLMGIVEKTIEYTKDFMGANDAALGNVAPTNTSAIIALQKTAVAPLELQKMNLYQFVEDYARIVYDIIRTHYGIRPAVVDDVEYYVDYRNISGEDALSVDIGPSEYWSESAQIQSLDNLFTKGIIDDALIYLENVPARVLPNKNKIIEAVKQTRQQAEADSMPYMQEVIQDEIL